jgi:phosphoribosylformimino-5-aminoimidazole carboxamide ribotide isomerase
VILYPAIDIMGGKAVRLTRGDFARSKIYDEDPLSAARGWVEQGARALHVVDLDGARVGEPVNLEHLRTIAAQAQVPVQYGGGLRSIEAVEAALAAGAHRAVLGTAALTDGSLLERALERWPERIVVSVDVRGGRVATAGWVQTMQSGGEDVLRALSARGVPDLVYTSVDRDGMLGGPDLEEVRAAARAVGEGSLIYSGGIGALADLEALATLGEPALAGVIVGKALYERRFTLAQGRAALENRAASDSRAAPEG